MILLDTWDRIVPWSESGQGASRLKAKGEMTQKYPVLSSCAVFSKNRKYRYFLSRELKGGKDAVMFLMLNPSLANEERNDNTVSWCIDFAGTLEFHWLYVTNLSPRCDIKSPDLKYAGPESKKVWKKNLSWIRNVARKSDLIVAAYGNDGALEGRAERVLKVLKSYDIYCLQENATGYPRHPRGVHQIAPPERYRRAI